MHSLQAFRGVAAILVVLHHAADIAEKYFPPASIEAHVLFGRSGVDFFFVLSGFIIHHAHRHWIGHPDRVGEYLWRRFARIYPVYWIVFLITLPLVFLLYRRLPEPHHVLMSFLLMRHEMIVYVAWTLVHEVAFYAVFCLMILNGRLGLAVFGAWLAAILLWSPSPLLFARWFDIGANHLTSPFNLLFFVGMLASWLVSRQWLRRPGANLGIGIAGALMFVMVGVLEHRLELDEQMDAFYAVASLLVVYGFAAWEQACPWLPPRTLALLGSASYSIYLVHSQAISACTKALIALGWRDSMHVTAVFVVSAIVSTACGLVFYRTIEQPLLERVRRTAPMGALHRPQS